MSQFITLVAGILGRRFLGPLQTGIWSLLQVILNYTQYSSFGAMNATLREIPFYKGKGDEAKVANIQNTSFSFSMFSSVVVAVLFVGYAFVMRARLSETIFYGLLLAGGLVVLRRMNDLLITLLRAHKFFGFASRQMVLSSLVNAVLIILLSYRFRLYGYVAAMAISLMFNITYIMMRQGFNFKWVVDIEQTKDLISYGMPLVLLGIMSTVLLSIDRIMIAKMIGLKELGLYSIAVMSYRYLSTFSNAVGNVLVPNLHEKYGKYDDRSKLEGTLSRTALFLSNVSPMLIGVMWFILPGMVSWVLPEFKGCVPAAKFLAIGAFFLAINNPYAHYVVAIRKHMQLFPIMIGVSILALVVNYVAIKRGFGIMGVAFGTSLVLFLRFAATYFLANISLTGLARTFKGFERIVRKFAFMIIVLVIVQKVLSGADDSAPLIGMRIILAQIFFIPLVIRLEKEFKIFESIRDKLTRRTA
ncbi:MAG: oligosaccharide flippase family protein [Candidatus Omnitrophica bacterium]|nr:oligosaccharide flippase family protein [Candidatus Omnitrophota bacterium]